MKLSVMVWVAACGLVGCVSAVDPVERVEGDEGDGSELVDGAAAEVEADGGDGEQVEAEVPIGTIDVYAGDELHAATREAIASLNAQIGSACLTLVGKPWPGSDVPPGVITLDLDESQRDRGSAIVERVEPGRGRATVTYNNATVIERALVHLLVADGAFGWQAPPEAIDAMQALCGASD